MPRPRRNPAEVITVNQTPAKLLPRRPTGYGALPLETALAYVCDGIDRAGLPTTLDTAFGIRGRPREFTTRTLLVALFLSAYEDDIHVNDGVEAARKLPADIQAELGFIDRTGIPMSYRYLWRFYKRCWRLVKAAPTITIGGNETRLDLDWWLCTTAMAFTPPDAPPVKTIAVDGTSIVAYHKPWRHPTAAERSALEADDPEDTTESVQPPNRASLDPDATFGYRTKTYTDERSIFFGFKLYPIVGADVGDPGFIRGAALATANAHPNKSSIDAVIATAKAINAKLVVADRGHTMLSADTWARPLRHAGIDIIADLHPNQIKSYGHEWNANGAKSQAPILELDGWFFTDGTPTHLHRPPEIGRAPGEHEQHASFFDQRAHYAFTVQRRDAHTMRILGPALTRKVHCINHDESIRDNALAPETTCEKGVPCSCATTRVIHLDGHPMEKAIQPFLWGTTKWCKEYGRRQLVETANAELKVHKAGLSRGSIRGSGLEGNCILLSLAIAKTNVMIERSWRLKNNLPPRIHDPLLVVEQRELHEPRAAKAA